MVAISKRLRYEILRRDNHACRYCGGTAPDIKLAVDHVLPVALGGSNDASNLVTSCTSCNFGKAASNPDQPLVEQVSADQVRWAQAVQRAVAQAVSDTQKRDRFVAAFDAAWHRNDYGQANEYTHPKPWDWEAKIGVFYSRGLPMEVLADAAYIACSNINLPIERVWVYFLGICWKRLTAIEEAARAMFVSDVPLGGDADV